jgi:hypothetical protein
LGFLRRFFASALALTLVLGACIPDLQTSGSYCGDGFVDSALAEECDPGPEKAAGCTAECKIDCKGGIVDPTSGHCYLVFAATIARSQAESACLASASHLVTFGSEEELFRLIPLLPSSVERFWVGLERDPTTQLYTSVAPDEPGWGPPARCPGCWARTDKDDLARAPAAVGFLPCVAASTKPQDPWVQTRCELQITVSPICEREPPGRTSSECGSAVCITLRKTPAKRYQYFRAGKTSEGASQACKDLGGSLVILESREEREQLVREVSNYSKDPYSFWIGLAQSNGTWRWDDGVMLGDRGRPLPWGDREPRGKGRAYVTAHLGAYDTQLAHADVDAERPYVCQLPR